MKIGQKYRREQALGLHEFKALYSNDGACRYLIDGDIVEFLLVETKYTNAQFMINGNPSHKIWHSQLNGIYLNPHRNCCKTGILHLKDGQSESMGLMQYRKFWALVKGRKFRVTIDPDFPVVIDPKNKEVARINNVYNVINHIFKNLDEENYDVVIGMTKRGTLYNLEEV